MSVNVNSPNGFQRFGLLDGASPTMGDQVRKVAAADSSAIGYGDPVVSLSTGYVTIATAGTTQIAGIFRGCYYLNTAVGRVVWSPNWPGGTQGSDATCYIDSDPNALFVAQAYNTAIVFADIDANINFKIGTPNTTAAGGYSTSSLDQSTIDTTSTLPFRIVGLLSDYLPANSQPGTDDSSAYNRAIVAFNFTDRKSTTGIA
ncbi:MAG: hypothetical protein KGL39_06445 [Patescibacteria group bacterium]|nr:hypothetical protein [Patescibacteria group bacterium]